ncbi:CD209 antigen-like protein E isoform X1 [Poecile atricapillus]|uniref:CD209 antigen-like protein E isoform X1 n=1 Tax=Poecile atricapillus TaxID=48891 RepID=UPI002738DF24|nr:CD209 antigen-like protein E isoform X1 [Poecile atricapillus]
MTQQETYGNWLGPKRLLRQPAIYSVPGKMSPVGNFRPASPDSFEDDYDDVSVVGSDQGPPAKGVYLLAGPPGSSQAPSLKDPEDFSPSSRDSDPKSRDLAPKSGNSALVAVLALLVALSALAWGGLLAVAIGKHKEMSAELELLKSNLSGIWDSVQQEQTRLQFGIHQHQLELQELTELLCQARSSRRCQAGWKSHGNSCYSFSRDSLSWSSARNACGDLGAHLAVVSSEEEQVFLLENSNRSSSYWLGVTDGEQEGKWLWVTGEDPDFRFWDVWLEDSERELKDCGTIGPRGLWVNARCSEFHRWICEKPGNC